jgi:hypothetical protein
MERLESTKAINSFKQKKGAYTKKLSILKMMCDLHFELFAIDLFPHHLKSN